MAEEEGFEPSYPRRGKRFSRPPHSTTLPPLRKGDVAPEGATIKFWRRVRDLNPGDALGAYTISNRAPSATRTTLRVQHRKLYRIFPTMQTGILCSSYKRGEEGAVTGWWMLDGELIGGSAVRGRADSADRLARLAQARAAIRARYATRHHLA